jgi:hypothetical protein
VAQVPFDGAQPLMGHAHRTRQKAPKGLLVVGTAETDRIASTASIREAGTVASNSR